MHRACTGDVYTCIFSLFPCNYRILEALCERFDWLVVTVGRVYAGFMVRKRDKTKELGGSSEWM